MIGSCSLPRGPAASKKSCRCGCPGHASITGRAEAELLEYLSEQIREEVERSLKAEGTHDRS